MTTIQVGTQVQTLLGEIDTDADGQERITPPGTIGVVTHHNHADHWDVSFPNGAWVVLTETEMADPTQYKLENNT